MQTFLPATIPYTIYGNREDDIRLGSCAVNFIDFEKMLVADMFLTNTGVWALYERLPFARSETNIYAAFTFVKRVADASQATRTNCRSGSWGLGRVGLRVVSKNVDGAEGRACARVGCAGGQGLCKDTTESVATVCG